MAKSAKQITAMEKRPAKKKKGCMIGMQENAKGIQKLHTNKKQQNFKQSPKDLNDTCQFQICQD